MSLLAYQQMKPSGIEYSDEIPSDWSLKRLGDLVAFAQGKAHEPYIDDDGDYICVNSRFVSTSGKTIKRCSVNLTPASLNDILMVMSDLPNGRALARAYYVDDHGKYAVNQRVCRITAEKAHSRFLFYLLDRHPGLMQNDDGVHQTHLSNSDFQKLKLYLPSVSEQNQIARFLDHETARIDALIEEQQRLIELLKEKRQAVISHAVTKGLDPTAPMKDSGVEWLGEVPAHWGFGKIRYFAKIESGHTPSRSKPEYWENCTIPWFSLADVWQIRSGEVIELFETKELVSEFGLANSSARLLPKGTVVLSRTASVGYSAIMGCDMATTQDFANWVCGSKLDNTYLLFCFRAMKSEFDRLMVGSTHKTIYMPDIAGLVCSVPPLDEQGEIAAHIKISNSKFGDMIDEAERMKKLLSERRSALISAAVTGKIDVRGWKPPASLPSPELVQEAM
ncbi:restriction endonuclease subunit S [Pseudomonas reactans]|uniref:restriction endonuclease subunit S n=1 Tax=Pseudomonas corrugata TaxID=47879 RepID=UPI0028C48842|nr:restriction endonuclease subunit S [Pseudomonas corrugata]MDU9033174.1 restriction endonuclease subunit S [Pseudomonas corrugata]